MYMSLVLGITQRPTWNGKRCEIQKPHPFKLFRFYIEDNNIHLLSPTRIVTQCNELCNLSKINVTISLSQQCFIKAPAILRESQYKSLIVLAFIRLLMFISTSLNRDLRTVPTFVSAHTFCASRKAWFTRHARAGLT